MRSEAGRPLSLCDIGCWDGEPTAVYRGILGGNAAGIEVFGPEAERAREKGIDVAQVDLETESFPWADGSFDVVIANQVFEHLKNVWLPMSEIARILRVGGHLVFSVPNLASLHNRLMLAFGWQPSSIRTFGPHVRSFTYRQVHEFLAFGGCFAVQRSVGVGFYPLPTGASLPLARAWPAASHTPVFVARRMEGDPRCWLAWSQRERAAGEQTFYSAAGT